MAIILQMKRCSLPRTMGEPASEPEKSLLTPFTRPDNLLCPGKTRQSRSRSEPSKSPVDDVAESSAIFASAFRRMLLGKLESNVY
ncbi:hypothetical protein NHQ30_010572 [Ciborinia camelliae]|nr:hypothetical protein NHQ30_010572 [Ciborinia camelliae]